MHPPAILTRGALALLLAAVWSAAAEAQLPTSRSTSRPTTSVVERIRELTCRGGEGLDLQVQHDSSPGDPGKQLVGMELRYRRSTRPVFSEFERLEPGTCTWNPYGLANEPQEPGVVYFDIQAHAQPWTAQGTRHMDTTVNAAVFFVDTISLKRYLGDPQKFWRFFVFDPASVSNSFGAFRPPVTQPSLVEVTGSFIREAPRTASATRFAATRELLCRGGPSGLDFARGAPAGSSGGASLVTMTLTYTQSRNAPGETGRGLDPGTCAWVDRTGSPPEPGRVEFTTPGNAQVKQAQSGSAVDRSPTAAERWPDANTIPAYMTSSSHFWRFTVDRSAPAVAQTHAAWKRDVAITRPDGAARRGTTSDAVRAATGIRNVEVSVGLEGVAIRFATGTSTKPVVLVSTEPPKGAPGSYDFTGPVRQLTVGGTQAGSAWRWAAASPTPLPRDTRHWFIIRMAESGGVPGDDQAGEFKTLGQRATIAVTEINLLADGDSDSNGELSFEFLACPPGALPDEELPRSYPDIQHFPRLDWGEGRHKVNVVLADPGKSAPDILQLRVSGNEMDPHGVMPGGERIEHTPSERCDIVGGIDPGRNNRYEWNTLLIDFDLRKFPGAGGGEQFIRRSKPMRNGSSLMFEIRGYVQVTRQ